MEKDYSNDLNRIAELVEWAQGASIGIHEGCEKVFPKLAEEKYSYFNLSWWCFIMTIGSIKAALIMLDINTKGKSSRYYDDVLREVLKNKGSTVNDSKKSSAQKRVMNEMCKHYKRGWTAYQDVTDYVNRYRGQPKDFSYAAIGLWAMHNLKNDSVLDSQEDQLAATLGAYFKYTGSELYSIII